MWLAVRSMLINIPPIFRRLWASRQLGSVPTWLRSANSTTTVHRRHRTESPQPHPRRMVHVGTSPAFPRCACDGLCFPFREGLILVALSVTQSWAHLRIADSAKATLAVVVPCDLPATEWIQPSAEAARPKAETVKPWGVEIVGGTTRANALARYRDWQPKFAALVAGREPHVVIRGIVGQSGAARVRIGDDTRARGRKIMRLAQGGRHLLRCDAQLSGRRSAWPRPRWLPEIDQFGSRIGFVKLY